MPALLPPIPPKPSGPPTRGQMIRDLAMGAVVAGVTLSTLVWVVVPTLSRSITLVATTGPIDTGAPPPPLPIILIGAFIALTVLVLWILIPPVGEMP